jgi:hypothetical protein
MLPYFWIKHGIPFCSGLLIIVIKPKAKESFFMAITFYIVKNTLTEFEYFSSIYRVYHSNPIQAITFYGTEMK